MGVWGTGVFQNDLAADMRNTFHDRLNTGGSVEEATTQVMAEYGDDAIGDYNDDSVFWLALAALQLEVGALFPDVRQEALRVIDTGADIRLWEGDAEPDTVESRRETLQALRLRLSSS